MQHPRVRERGDRAGAVSSSSVTQDENGARIVSTMPINREYQELAEEAVRKTGQRFDAESGGKWAEMLWRNRDSDLLTNSNFETVIHDMTDRFPDDVEDNRSRNAATGWGDALVVRMLGDDGKVTDAGVAILDWTAKLDDYPVADEQDYSKRQFEATIENVKTEGVFDDKVANMVLEWLSKNDSKAIKDSEDGSQWVDREDIKMAVRALRKSGKLPPAEDAIKDIIIRRADPYLRFDVVLRDGTKEPVFLFDPAGVDVERLDLDQFLDLETDEARERFELVTGVETFV